MGLNVYLLIIFFISLFVIFLLVFKLRRVNEQLSVISDALRDIKSGNLNRRILAKEQDVTKKICYDINEIAVDSQARLIRQKQSEQAYKRLVTSLSHDVKTPLTSLVGYLEAVESKIVADEEKDAYIRVALDKAHSLKSFVYSLFEWVKLDAGEQNFHFELYDLNELSRDVLADWIPILESNGLDYEIEIPESECFLHVDINAYIRILNNLTQNVITHSGANKMFFIQAESAEQVVITISDNGKGISENDLPHIFERMYQCDNSRSASGNGLGLAITKELVSVHKGTIRAESTQGTGTAFHISFPKTMQFAYIKT